MYNLKKESVCVRETEKETQRKGELNTSHKTVKYKSQDSIS